MSMPTLAAAVIARAVMDIGDSRHVLATSAGTNHSTRSDRSRGHSALAWINEQIATPAIEFATACDVLGSSPERMRLLIAECIGGSVNQDGTLRPEHNPIMVRAFAARWFKNLATPEGLETIDDDDSED